jgi:hypothetical protein
VTDTRFSCAQVVGLSLALGLGCEPEVLVCHQHRECTRGEDFGMCQPNGLCSFADDRCISGQRYGASAGRLRGECVVLGEDDDGPKPQQDTDLYPDVDFGEDEPTAGQESTGFDTSTGGTTAATDTDGCTEGCTCAWTFEDGEPLDGWVRSGSWSLYAYAPTSDLESVSFGAQGHVLGTDGNRAPPYPGAESEASSATSPGLVIPPLLRFRSWHVDEGGREAYDTKRILVSTDEGASFDVLLDCAAGPNAELPLCQPREAPRAGDSWDDVELDTAAHAGMLGRLRFEYDTNDECCGFEQGWFIDDLGVSECG